MKKIIVCLLISLSALAGAQAQKSIQGIFDKYTDDERFTYVSVGSGLVNFVSNASIGLGDVDAFSVNKGIFSKMEKMKILTLKPAFDDNAKLAKSIISDIENIVKNGKFETLVEVRDKSEKVNVYISPNKQDILVINHNTSEMSLIWMYGSNK